jgi:hypothetical protein
MSSIDDDIDDDIEKLLHLEILAEISAHESLPPGKVLRRICGGKDQQGLFTGLDDSSGLIVVNVVDMAVPLSWPRRAS